MTRTAAPKKSPSRRLAALEREQTRSLLMRLDVYTEHDVTCPLWPKRVQSGRVPEYRCTCGLSQLRKELEPWAAV